MSITIRTQLVSADLRRFSHGCRTNLKHTYVPLVELRELRMWTHQRRPGFDYLACSDSG